VTIATVAATKEKVAPGPGIAMEKNVTAPDVFSQDVERFAGDREKSLSVQIKDVLA
jgi:hypothetical protein